MWAASLMYLIRQAVRIGYRPAAAAAPGAASWQWGGEEDADLSGCPRVLARATSALCLPTYLDRCALASHVAAVRRASEQVCALVHAQDDCLLIVALQYGPGQAAQAAMRARAILDAMPEPERARICVALIGTLGKVGALNTCIDALRRARAPIRFFGWLDDDILFKPDTFARLRAYMETDPGCEMAGARKIPVANRQRAASVLNRMKKVARTSSVPHPHGCAVLLRWRAIEAGIPAQFTSDDGYLAIHLFDETSPAHYRRMAIVPDACCWHTVGGPAPEIWKRVHRTIYENMLLLAYFPPRKSALFFRSAIAHGLTLFPRNRTAALNVVLKLLLVAMYVRACAVLLVAGLCGRPMRDVEWSPYSGLNLPGGEPR